MNAAAVIALGGLTGPDIDGNLVPYQPLYSPAHGLASSANHRFTRLAVAFSRPLSDDEAEQAAGIAGYAWTVYGAAQHSGNVGDSIVDWDESGQVMFITTRMDLRPELTRSRSEATEGLVAALVKFLSEGTPQRKRHDNTRLIDAVLDPIQGDEVLAIYTD